MDQEYTFEEELEWCINQVLIGLTSSNPDSQQVNESKRVIEKLSGTKLSFIAKRHLMNVVFGDYRKQMKNVSLQRTREELSKHDIQSITSQYNIKYQR